MSKGEAQTASGGILKTHPMCIYEGRVAEWLGKGLQNLLRWFEPTRDLAYCSLFRLFTEKYLPGWRNW